MGDVESSGMVGALGTYLILQTALPPAEAIRPAISWEGDTYVSWRDGDRTCVSVRLLMGSPWESLAAADLFDRWGRPADRGARRGGGHDRGHQLPVRSDGGPLDDGRAGATPQNRWVSSSVDVARFRGIATVAMSGQGRIRLQVARHRRRSSTLPAKPPASPVGWADVATKRDLDQLRVAVPPATGR